MISIGTGKKIDENAIVGYKSTRKIENLDLEIGKDFDIVGWCVDEAYESSFLPPFIGGIVPPAVTWRAETMAETAFNRLAERRKDPGLEPLIVKVPTRLRFAD